MRPAHRRLAALSALFALSLLSCGREVTGPDNGFQYGRPRRAALALDPQMPSLLASLEGAGDVVAFNRVRVVLRNDSNEVVLDTMVDFPADADTVALTVSIDLPLNTPEAGLPLQLSMAYVNAAGDTVFRGGPAPVVAAPIGSGGASQPITIPIVYDGVGKNATSVVITPPTDTVMAGTSSSFSAVARDATNTVIPLTPILFYTLDSARAVVPSVGSGTVNWLPNRGTARIVAALPDGQPSDTAYVLVELPASQLVLGSGGGQSGTFGVALASPIVVRTLASDNVPVPGVEVVFAVATGGGSLATLVDTSDANGDVSTIWTLGSVIGAQTITATAPGLTGSPLAITGTATAGPPARVEITAAPTTMVAGVTFAPAFAATVRDNAGNLVTTFGGAVTVALDTGANATLSGTATVNAVGGVATFAGLSIDKVGAWDLYATSGALIPDTAVVTITPAAASALAYIQEPTSALAGTPISPNITIRAHDAFGNLTPSFTGNVTLAIGSGPGGAAIAGTATRAAVGGVATFDDISLNIAGNYTLSASSAPLTSATSGSFSITAAGAATMQLIAGNFQTDTAGATLADSLAVRVLDAFLNPVAGVQVDFSTTNGSFSPVSVLTNANGEARAAWTLGTVAGPATAKAASAGLTDADFTGTVTPGAAVALQIDTQPQDTVVAGVAATPVVVSARDQHGNVVSLGAVVDLDLALNPVGGTQIAGATSVGFSSGIAAFTGIALDKAGAYQLRFTVPALPPVVSDTVTVVAAAAAARAITAGEGQTGPIGAALVDTLRVQVTDAFGNAVAGHSVSWTSTLGGGTAVPSSSFTDASGIAKSVWVLGDSIGTQTLSATPNGLTALVFSATGTPGTPTAIEFQTAPDGLMIAGVAASPTVIAVKDAQGNTVTNFNGYAHVLLQLQPVGASILAGGDSVAFVSGLATFSGLTLDIAGPYILQFNVGAFPALLSDTILVSAGAADTIFAVSGDGQTGEPSTTLAAPVRVRVLDAFGNPVGNVGVTYDVVSGDADPAITTVFTDSTGHSETEIVLHGTLGPVVIHAILAGANGSPVVFNASIEFNSPTVVQLTASPATAVAGVATSPFSVAFEDALSNPFTDYTDSVRFTVITGPVGAPTSGTTVKAATAGVATFDDLVFTLRGSYQVRIVGDGVADTAFATVVVTAAAADTIVMFGGDAQSATVVSTLPLPLEVRIFDAFGNAVPGVNVNWGVLSGDANVSAPTTVSDTNGFASVGVSTLSTPGPIQAQASVGGLPGSPITFNATSTAGAAAYLLVETQPADAAAGDTLAFSVSARDSVGNLVTTFTGLVNVAVDSGPLGSIIVGNANVNAVGGIATFSENFLILAGVHRLGFTSPGLADTTSNTFTITPGAAAAIALEDGNFQTDTVLSTIAAPVRVRVSDQFGNRVSGHAVAWSVVSGDAIVGDDTTFTDGNGLANVLVTLGDTVGGVTVHATATGLTGSPVVFSAIATNDVFAALEQTSGPTTVVAGATIGTYTIRAHDAHGNTIADFSDLVTVTIADGPLGALSGGTASVNAVGGIASFSDLQLDQAGNYTLNFNSGAANLPALLTVTAASAASLEFSVQPSVSTAGEVLPSFAVIARDGFNNIVATFDSALISIDSGTVGAVLTGTVQRAPTAGVATFDDLFINLSGTYRLSASWPGLTSAVSNSFVVFPSAPDSMALLDGDAQSATIQAALPNPLRVIVFDSLGNAVPGVNVIWAVVSGFATLDTTEVATDSLGIAAVNLTFGDSVGVVEISAGVGGLNGSPITFTLGVLNAPAVRMVVEAAPSGEIAGATLGALVVSARDSVLNYAIDFAGTISVAIDSGPAGAVLSGGTSQPTTAGVATFSDLSLDLAGDYRLRVTSVGLADTLTSVFSVAAGTPSSIALVDGDAQTDTVTRELDLPLRVLVTDALGNPIGGYAVAWSVTSGDAFVSQDTVLTGVDGISFVTVTLGSAAGAVAIEAAADGLAGSAVAFGATAVTDSFAVLAVTTSPDTVQSGSSLPFVVEARDAHGNVLTDFTATINVAITGGPVSSFAGGTVNQNAAAGAANFGDLVFSAIGTYELTFDHSGVTVIDSVVVAVGAASSFFIVDGSNQTQMAGLTLDSALIVRVQDSNGNGIAGDTVVFTVTSGGGLVDGAAADTVLTDSTGHATTLWTLGATLGAQTVEATHFVLGTHQFDATATEMVANVVWHGTVDTDWTNTANWKDGVVPTNADSVLVPAGRPNYPALAGNIGMARLTMTEGASIDMQGWDILVFGSISVPLTGAMTNGGALYANGDSGTIVGRFTSLGIQGGSYTAIGGVETVTTLRAFNNGRLDFGTHLHGVGTDLITETGGTIAQSAGGTIFVSGNADFQGGSTAGMLTGGTLVVGGSFTALGSGAFSADSAHRVEFNGAAQQTIFLSAPDTTLAMSCASSCFGEVVATKGSTAPGLRFLSDAKALGGFNVSVDTIGGENIVLVAGAPSTFDVTDVAVKRLATRGLTSRGGVFNPDTLVLWGDADVVFGGETIPTIVAGSASLGNSSPVDAPVWVDGTLDITGIAQLNSTLTLRGTGRLTMHEPDDTLVIGGDFYAQTDIGSDTTMTAGHLQLQSNFLQVGGGTGFRASVGHTTRFGGASPTLTLSSGALNEFGTLVTSQPTGLAVSGNLRINGDVIIEGTSGAGYINDSGGGIATLNGNLIDSLGGRWQYDTLHLAGNDPILPALLYADVTVMLSVVLDTTLYVNSMTVSGSSALFDPNARVATIAGAFTTQNGGVLVMDDAADTVVVLGNASFHGGTSNLTQGRLDIYGHFDQGTEAESFAAGPAHSTWFRGASPSTVNFANPGFGTGASSFGELYLAKDVGIPVALGTDTYVNGKLETGIAVQYSLTGSGYKIVSRGADVNDLTFTNIRWHLVEGEAIDTILRVTFSTMDPDSVQFYIERNIGPITLDSPTFSTTPTGGRYLEVADADGATSVVVNVVNPLPAQHGGFVLETAGGLITGWLDFPALNWSNGSLDRDWFNAGNWAEGRVPTATDSVIVGPVGSSDMPIINGSSAFAGQLVSTGLNYISLETQLTVSKRLALPTESAGIVCGSSAATVSFTGADTASVRGRVACFAEAINTVMVVDGTSRIDSMTVTGTSRLAMRDDTLQVDKGFIVTGSGALEMVDDAALLDLKSFAIFGGATAASTLTAGTLRVAGAFVQSGTETFNASGTHVTEIASDVVFTSSTIQFSDFTTSGFNRLRVATTLDIADVARIADTARFEPTANVTGATARLIIGGDLSAAPGSWLDVQVVELAGVFADSGIYAADTTVFNGTGQVIPFTVNEQTRNYESIRVAGSATMTGAMFQTYTLNGDLTSTGSLVVPDSFTIAVTGNLRTLGSGTLAMNGSSQANLEIGGDAEFRGGSTTGLLTSGTLRVRGSFLQSNENSTSSFAASDSLTVVMDRAGIITLQDPVNSGFGALRINAYSGGTGYVLESHIRAVKFESEGEGDSTRVTAGPAHGGNPAIITADTIIVQNELAAVNVALKLLGGELSNFGGIGYSAFASSAVPQLEIEAAGGAYNAGDVRFDGTAVPPLYVRLNETVTGDLDTLQLTFGVVNPPVHGGYVQLAGDAFFTNWVADPEFRWTGALDGTWANPGNWATNIVPTSSDSAYVPASVTNKPNLDVPVTLRVLVSDYAADTIDVTGNLTITEQLQVTRTTGLKCSAAQVEFTTAANKTVGGRINCFTLFNDGAATVVDSTALNSVQIGGSGTLIVTDDTLSVAGNLNTTGGGRLQMNGDPARVTVYGNAQFDGASSDGFLNRGRLRIQGNFIQLGTGTFISTFLHTTAFFDEAELGTRTISFADTVTGRFRNLEFSDGVWQLDTRVNAEGEVVVGDGVSLVGVAGSRIAMTLGGTYAQAATANVVLPALEIPFGLAISGTGFDVDTVIFAGTEAKIAPAFNVERTDAISYDNVIVRGDWTFYRSDTSSAIYSVANTFTVADSGIARFGGATNQTAVVIGGHLMTLDSARVEMAHANTGVLVQQNAVFQGASTEGLLTAGLLSVRGDFGQGGHVEAYSADPGHTTSLEGTAAQTVTFADPGPFAGGSHFGTLRLRPSSGGMSMVLGNAVFVRGAITADTIGNYPATISSASTQYITSFGGHVLGGLTFDNVHWTILNGELLDTLESLTFTNISTDTTQLRFVREEGVVHLISPTFSTAGTGTILRAEDFAGGGSPDFTVEVSNPVPLYHDFRADAVGGFATINGWPAEVQFVWTGAVNNDWFTAGNWSMDSIPTSFDTVSIEATATNRPIIANDTINYIASLFNYSDTLPVFLGGDSTRLVIAHGGNMILPGASPGISCATDSSFVYVGGVSGQTGDVSGWVGCRLRIYDNGVRVVDSLRVSGDLDIAGPLSFAPGGQRLTAMGARTEVSSGSITMSDAADTLDVAGDFVVYSAQASTLTDGLLLIGGDFQQDFYNGNFKAEPSHETRFFNNGTIYFGGGSDTSSNHFGTVDVQSGTRSLASRAVAKGTLVINGGANIDSTFTLEVHGVFGGPLGATIAVDELWVGGTFGFTGNMSAVDSVRFIGTNQLIPFTIGGNAINFNNIIVSGTAHMVGSDSLPGYVNVRDGGTLRFGAPDTTTNVVIDKNLSTFLGGRIQMTDTGTVVTVDETIDFGGGPTLGMLTEGSLRGRLGFYADDSAFMATGNHLTDLLGCAMCEGSPLPIWMFGDSVRFNDLRVSIWYDAPYGIRARNLEITNGSSLDSAEYVRLTGSLFGGDNSSEFRSKSLHFADSLAFRGSLFDADTVVLTGTGQRLVSRQPDGDLIPYQYVRVLGTAQTAMANGDSIVVTNNLIVSGGGHLAFGETDSTTLVRIEGQLVTEDSATVEMSVPATNVRAMAGAYFGGGSTAGLLTAGILHVHGTFTQDSTTSLASYAATGAHVTYLYEAEPRTVSFASPGFGGSRFGELLVLPMMGGWVELQSDIYVETKLTVFGVYEVEFRSPVSEFHRVYTNGADLTNADFRRTGLTLAGTGTIAALNDLTFNEVPPDSVAWEFTRADGTYPVNGLVFGSTPTTGKYLVINDPDAGSDLTVDVQNVTPGYYGTFVDVLNTATLTGWLENGPFVWTGGGGNQTFTNPLNWNVGLVPTATDSVYYDSTAALTMEISSPTTLGAFVMKGIGASLYLTDELTVTRALQIGNGSASCEASGAFVLAGTGSVRFQADTLNCPLSITNGTVYVDSTSVVESVALLENGTIDLDGAKLTVGNNFTVGDTAALVMNGAADTLIVRGQALFGGRSTVGLLTDGLLEVGHSILQGGISTAFHATENHHTVLRYPGASTDTVTIDFNDAGPSRFAFLTIDSTARAVTKPMHVDSLLRLTGNAKLVPDLLLGINSTVTAMGGLSTGQQTEINVGRFALRGEWVGDSGIFSPDTADFLGQASGEQLIRKANPWQQHTYEVMRIFGDARLGQPFGGDYRITDTLLVLDGTLSIGVAGEGGISVNPSFLGQPTAALIVNGPAARLAMDGSSDVRFRDVRFLDGITDSTTLVFGDLYVYRHFEAAPAAFSAGSQDPEAGDVHQVIMMGDSSSITLGDPEAARFYNLTFNRGSDTELWSDVYINGRFSRGVMDSSTAISIRSNVLNTVAPHTIHAFGGTAWGMIGSGYELTLRNVEVVLYGSNDPAVNGTFEFDDVRWEQMFPEATFLTVAEAGNYIGLDSAVFEGLQFNSGVTTGKYFEISVQSSGANPEVQFQNSSPSVGCMNSVCNATDFEPGTPELATWTGANDSGWHDVANWSTGLVPDANTDVLIPNGAISNEAFISTATAVRSITVQSERLLTLNNNLTVNGDIVADGTISSSGGQLEHRPRDSFTNFGLSVSGIIANYATVAGPGGLVGQFEAVGPITVANTFNISVGRFNVNGQKVTVGELLTNGSGFLQMTSPADTVIVNGGVTFDGASTDGLLTAGVLDVGGNFSQWSTNSAESFAASGTHLTVLRGSIPHTISFVNPGPGTGSSHFGHVLAINGGNIKDVASELWVTGAFQVTGGTYLNSTIGYTRLVSSGGSTSGVTFGGIRWEINPGEPMGTLQGLQFYGQDPSVTQLSITRFGADTIDITGAEFDPVTFTGGAYFSLLDVEGDSNLVVNFTTVSPVGHENAYILGGGASFNGWSEYLSLTFTGASDGDVTNVANWLEAALPTASDSVVVNNSGGSTMNVNAAFAVRSFVAFPGAVVDVSDTLSVTNTLRLSGSTTTCSGDGTFKLVSAQVLAGTAPTCDLVVAVGGIAQLADSSRFENVRVQDNAQLAVGNTALFVQANLSTVGQGSLRMFGAQDSVVVSGDAIFTGGSTAGWMNDGYFVLLGNLVAGGATSTALVTGPDLQFHLGNPNESGGTREVTFIHDTLSYIGTLIHHAGTTTIVDGSILPVRDSLMMVETDANTITGTLGARLRVGFDDDGSQYGFFSGSDQAVVTVSNFEMYGQFYAGDQIKPDTMEFLGTGSADNGGSQLIPSVSQEETSFGYKVLRVRGEAEISQENYPSNPGLHVSQRLEVMDGGLLFIGSALSEAVHVRADTADIIVSGTGAISMIDDSAQVVVDSIHFESASTSNLDLGLMRVRGAMYERTFASNTSQFMVGSGFRHVFDGDVTVDFPNGASLNDVQFAGGTTVTLATLLNVSGKFSRESPSGGQVTIRAVDFGASNSQSLQVVGGFDVNVGDDPVLFRNVALTIYAYAVNSDVFDVNRLTFSDFDPAVTALFTEAVGYGTPTLSYINFNYLVTTGRYFENSPNGADAVTFTNSSPVVGCMLTGCAAGDVAPFDVEPAFWDGSESSDFTDGDNWSIGRVPDAYTNVYITSGMPFDPVLSTSQLQVRDLTLAASSSLTFSGFEVLYVRGNIYNEGSILGASGLLQMPQGDSASLYSSGSWQPKLQVVGGFGGAQGVVALASNVNASDEVEIGSTGRINLNGYTLTTPTFFTSGGRLTMNQPSSILDVSGNVGFSGGDNSGHLLDGVIYVGGNFTQSGPSSYAFPANGSHLVAFVGGGTSTVSFSQAGLNDSSHFANIAFDKTGGGSVLFSNTQAYVTENVSSWTSAIEVQFGHLRVNGTIADPSGNTISLGASGLMSLLNPVYNAALCGPIGSYLNVVGNPGNFFPGDGLCVDIVAQGLVGTGQSHQNQDEQRWESLRQYVFRD